VKPNYERQEELVERVRSPAYLSRFEGCEGVLEVFETIREQPEVVELIEMYGPRLRSRKLFDVFLEVLEADSVPHHDDDLFLASLVVVLEACNSKCKRSVRRRVGGAASSWVWSKIAAAEISNTEGTRSYLFPFPYRR
jgi:hypothetical protein